MALALFLLAGSAGVLLAARVVQGVATGIASTSLAGWLYVSAPGRAAGLNSLAPMVGIGGGALLASLVVFASPHPASSIFITLFVAFSALFVAVMRSAAITRSRPSP